MQWLIDIIKAWIVDQGYLTTSFVLRGDPATPDFEMADFTKDANWHDLNLSSIVPEHAKKVQMEFLCKNSGVARWVQFRPKSNTNIWLRAGTYILVADLAHEKGVDIALDENRIIEYRCHATGWLTLTLTVKGWWF